MNVVVTGGTGFLGSAVVKRLLARGDHVTIMCRNEPAGPERIMWKYGDILKHIEPLIKEPIDAVYHLAGIVNLSPRDKNGMIERTNVEGTRNVIDFCLRQTVPHLYYASTAYTSGRNPYERSKSEAEAMVKNCSVPRLTIFKPSIVIGTADHMHLENFAQFALLLMHVHRRAELVRRKIEGTLHLPVLEPVFHLRGNPKGNLNMVPVDTVAEAMARITQPGTFWLTHPRPPLLVDVVSWLGESVLLKMIVAKDFNATPIELAFERLAAAFKPYLLGDQFPSDLSECPPITKELISDIVRHTVMHET